MVLMSILRSSDSTESATARASPSSERAVCITIKAFIWPMSPIYQPPDLRVSMTTSAT
uniref:Uncharacterized protein n=1 Tax=Rhizophora mucronata TaxID=61149 RepID=A0A2P2QL55_RHIMU